MLLLLIGPQSSERTWGFYVTMLRERGISSLWELILYQRMCRDARD